MAECGRRLILYRRQGKAATYRNNPIQQISVALITNKLRLGLWSKSIYFSKRGQRTEHVFKVKFGLGLLPSQRELALFTLPKYFNFDYGDLH